MGGVGVFTLKLKISNMRYFVNCKGLRLDDDEFKIECELRVGDYCSRYLDNEDEAIIKIATRIYYSDSNEWIFFGEIARINKND